MANIDLGQDVANKRERIETKLLMLTILIPYSNL